MYKLKNVAKRGSALLGAVGLLAGIGTSALPSFASANSLNPLTKRSLTLSSSSPGWSYTDGSGNTLYAPPNSGANGKQTGNTFAFHNSTANGHIKTMSFQYCTKSAGGCWAPGDDASAGVDTTSTSDLNYVSTSTPAEVSGTTTPLSGTITVNSGSTTVTGTTGTTSFLSELAVGDSFITAGGHSYVVAAIATDESLTITTTGAATESGVTFAKSNFATVVDTQTGEVKSVPGVTDPLNTAGHPITTGQYAAHAVAGNFIVMYDNAGVWTQSTGWSMSVTNVEDPDDLPDHVHRGTNNYLILTKATGLDVPFDTPMKVFFFARTDNYLTNPGSGAFFVKINTYTKQFGDGTGGTVTTAGLEPTTGDNVIDGGVTVANVMNQSIQITTKVLETMQFSVGTVDPDTLSSDRGANPMSPLEEAQYDSGSPPAQRVKHTPCDPILMQRTFGDPANVLQLGDQDSESSLAVEHTYSTHSFWRLSSNSSAGATVYYSGHTLSNTENDQIDPIGPIASAPAAGSEQFGLALDNGTDGAGGTHAVDYSQEATYENGQDNGLTAIDTAGLTTDNVLSNGSWHTPKLQPLDPTTNYGGGTGGINGTIDTTFAFDANSDTIPAAIATESSQVVDCVTGKMRYIANIAATTPAGIYTTKVNYIAAPQY